MAKITDFPGKRQCGSIDPERVRSLVAPSGRERLERFHHQPSSVGQPKAARTADLKTRTGERVCRTPRSAAENEPAILPGNQQPAGKIDPAVGPGTGSQLFHGGKVAGGNPP